MTESKTKGYATIDRLATVLSYGVILLLGYLVFRIASPFLEPLAWATVIAIFFHPIYDRLARRIGEMYAALFSTFAVALLIVLPVLLILAYAAREAIDASTQFQSVLSSGAAFFSSEKMHWIHEHVPKPLQSYDFVAAARQAAEQGATKLAGTLGSLLLNFFNFIVNLMIFLFALFFMFKDGDEMVASFQSLLPFDADLQESMLKESQDLIFASVALMLLIALVQGLLGGIAFAVTGLMAPVFFALLIAFCSIVPVVGSALVWVPAAGWLAFQGHWGKALVVLVICGGVGATVDNLLRPLLLRSRTQMNDLVLFLALLGGLDVFGLVGLVLGPTIVAMAQGVMRSYKMEHDPQARAEA